MFDIHNLQTFTHNACITLPMRFLRSGDRIDRRLTGSMTVLTVLTVLVFCFGAKISYGQATVETVALTVRV